MELPLRRAMPASVSPATTVYSGQSLRGVQLLTDTGLTVFCDAGCIVGRGVAVGGSSVTRGVLVGTSNDCDGTAATSVGRSIMGSGVGGTVCDSEQALTRRTIPTRHNILRS